MKTTAFIAVLVAMPFCVAGVWVGLFLWFDRDEALIAQARPIVAAVNQYRADYGRFPERLELLTPRYVAPQTSIRAFLVISSGLEVKVGLKNSQRHFIFYDWGWIDRQAGWYKDLDDGAGPKFLRRE